MILKIHNKIFKMLITFETWIRDGLGGFGLGGNVQT